MLYASAENNGSEVNQSNDTFSERTADNTAKKKTKLIDTMPAALLESTIPLIAAILVWVWCGNSGRLNPVVLPTFGTVVSTFLSGISDGSLIEALGISIRLTSLIIQILRPIPPIAWIPLVILWMGIGEPSKVFLIFLGGFFTVLINVTDGIRYTDKKLTEVAAMMETPHIKYITQLVIPAAMPSVFTGLRVALGSCWTCVVAAELVASSSGIGYMISNARNFGQMDVVIVGMLAIGVIGKIMDVILNAIGNRMLAWNL